jgi:hypothetical protein
MPSLPKGWKPSAILFTTFTLLVFLTNLSVLIWATTHTSHPTSSSTSTRILHSSSTQAECTTLTDLNRWAHLAINILSTVLLSGSNFCMQCLSAPTRADINSAHAQGRWLDVGVPSVHNLRWIRGRRRWLWSVLGVSSLPLHLLYVACFFLCLYGLWMFGLIREIQLQFGGVYVDVGEQLRCILCGSRISGIHGREYF